MRDEDSGDERLVYPLRDGRLSRREFGALAAGAGLAAAVPRTAAAMEVDEMDVEVPTPDGKADACFVYPVKGARAGVLMWPDIFGLRPAFRQMARRLAESGYAVLVVNPFYRTQRAPTAPEHPDWSDPALRTMLLKLKDTLTPERVVTDATAFTAWLDAQPAVSPGHKLGACGYCMSGGFTLRAAAALPARIGAGASFHGGGLVTGAADSPDRLIPQVRAPFLIAIAANDDASEPQAKEVLKAAFAKSGVPAEVEVYPGTQHGWCPPDSSVYNREQADRAFARMLALFAKALG